MKIDNEQMLPVGNKFKAEPLEKNDAAVVTKESGSRRQADRVELSTNNSEVERLKKAMQVVPDMRTDRIAQLKAKIDAGTYQVEAKDVAGKLLQSWRELHGK